MAKLETERETPRFHQGTVLQISNPMFFDGFGAMRSVMSRPQLLSPTLIRCKWPAWRHADQFLSLNGTIIRSREKRKIFLFETHRPGYGKTYTMNLANETLGEPCKNYQNCLFSAFILVWEQYPRIELSLIPRTQEPENLYQWSLDNYIFLLYLLLPLTCWPVTVRVLLGRSKKTSSIVRRNAFCCISPNITPKSGEFPPNLLQVA